MIVWHADSVVYEHEPNSFENWSSPQPQM